MVLQGEVKRTLKRCGGGRAVGSDADAGKVFARGFERTTAIGGRRCYEASIADWVDIAN